ncbi:MAG: hypothetical protein IJH50_09680 [Kiritimatiellae bacterium]|nr:hypothetical protein [Kiritimatiellia bacterium]
MKRRIFHAAFVVACFDIRAIYVILKASIPLENVVARLILRGRNDIIALDFQT